MKEFSVIYVVGIIYYCRNFNTLYTKVLTGHIAIYFNVGCTDSEKCYLPALRYKSEITSKIKHNKVQITWKVFVLMNGKPVKVKIKNIKTLFNKFSDTSKKRMKLLKSDSETHFMQGQSWYV